MKQREPSSYLSAQSQQNKALTTSHSTPNNGIGFHQPCIYSFKSVYNGNAWKLYEICSTKKTPETLTRISLTTLWCLHCKLSTNFILFWRFHCWLWTSKCRLGKFLTLENCLNMTHSIGSLRLNAYGVCDHTHVNFKSFFNLVHMAKVA